ncbi:MAG: penicillin-insensitive murein endopeptidase [Deltaproteobacteria bacterium]|nr:penicillin-insensitive murein endopeptidase [Deltaproteobacteria bacterium]
MTRLTRDAFMDRFRGRSIDLASFPAEQKQQLSDEGVPLSNFSRLDRYEKDRRLAGEREFLGVFDAVRALNPETSPETSTGESVDVSDETGASTRAGRVLTILDQLAMPPFGASSVSSASIASSASTPATDRAAATATDAATAASADTADVPRTAGAEGTVVTSTADAASGATSSSSTAFASSESSGSHDALAEHALDVASFEHHAEPETRPAARLDLAGSVGTGGANRSADVRAVQARLRTLGFNVDVDGQFGAGTQSALKVFAAMSLGIERVSAAPARVGSGDRLFRALSSPRAPRWMEIPAEGPGFVNGDRDRHDFGSSRLVEVIRSVGAAYEANYLASHPGAPRITTNDASRPAGGDTPDHATHENGLDLDVRLPRRNGSVGTTVGSGDYDRNTTFEMIRYFLMDARVERILFHDSTLFARARRELPALAHKLQDGGPSHGNHFHVDVAAERIA